MVSPQFQEHVLQTGAFENDWTDFSGYYDQDQFLFPAGAGALSYDHYSEHGCMWPNTDITMYPHSDNFGYTSYYSPLQSFDPIFSTENTIHQKNDVDASILAQSNLSGALIPGLSPPMKNSCPRQRTFPSYGSSIALTSDTYLPQVSLLSSDLHSSTKNASTQGGISTSHFQSNASRHTRPPSKKRSIDEIEGYNVKEEDGAHLSSSTTSDPCYLSQPHMIVPSQGNSARMPYHGDHSITSLHRISHHYERDSLLLRPEDRPPASKQFSNKRFCRSAEDPVRLEAGIRAIPTHGTWQNPDDSLLKPTKKGGEQKKQALACLFCRERKIACGRPPANSPDQTCNQCSRRRIKCEYPTESRRGQHKRRRKTLESEATGQTQTQTPSSARSTSTSSSVASTSSTNTSASSPPTVVPPTSAQ